MIAVDREQAAEYVIACARLDFEFRPDDNAPDSHRAVETWQKRDDRMSAAMSALGRRETVMIYMSEYISEQLAGDRVVDARRAAYKARGLL